MSFIKPRNAADAADRLAVMTGLATGFAALVHSINIWETMVSADLAGTLNTLQTGGGIVLIAVFLPLFIWFKAAGSGPVVNPWKGESYFGEVARRAGMTAFSLLLVLNIIFSMLDRLLLSRISAEVMLDINISLALALFSLSFFVFSTGPIGAEADVE